MCYKLGLQTAKNPRIALFNAVRDSAPGDALQKFDAAIAAVAAFDAKHSRSHKYQLYDLNGVPPTQGTSNEK